MTDDSAIDYIRHVLTAKGWSAFELARRAKLSPSTINRPLSAERWPFQISRRTIQAVHRASGIDPAEFVGDLSDNADDADLVPIYDIEVSAGNGLIPTDSEDVVGQLSLPPGYLRRITNTPTRHLAIVTVTGDSMSPTLRGGDVVLIDTTKTNLGYDGLFVLRLDGALHVKRVQRGSKPGVLRILADNRETYAPYERSLGEVEAVGKVLWYGRKE